MVDGDSLGHPCCVLDADSPDDYPGSLREQDGHAEAWWTPKRAELLGRLEENAPALAPLYRGALSLAVRDTFPGRAHFIAHAMREILNRLPGALGPKVPGRGPGYEDLIAKVRDRWIAEGLPEDGRLTRPDEESVPSASGPPHQAVSLDFLASVGRLVHNYRAVQANREDRERSGFAALGDEGPAPRYVVKNWRNLFPNAEQYAHAWDEPLPAKADDEWVSNFFAFEEFLMIIFKPSHENLADLDRLLDEANKR